MRKFDLNLVTTAKAVMHIQLSDEELSRVAENIGITVPELTITDLLDVILDKYSSSDTPSLCAHCSGWGKNYSLNIDSEWQLDDEIGVRALTETT